MHQMFRCRHVVSVIVVIDRAIAAINTATVGQTMWHAVRGIMLAWQLVQRLPDCLRLDRADGSCSLWGYDMQSLRYDSVYGDGVQGSH